MNLNQLELPRILQETNYNQLKAAEKQNVVQSAANLLLQLFEEEDSSLLFKRHGKKLLGLTPIGERVMEQVERINDDLIQRLHHHRADIAICTEKAHRRQQTDDHA